MFALTWNHEAYKVSGQSMEDDSIYEGDFVVIDKKARVVDGDIVVAHLADDTYLVKHHMRDLVSSTQIHIAELNLFQLNKNIVFKRKK